MRVVNAIYHNRIAAKADADYRRASIALCVPSAVAPLHMLALSLGGFGLPLSWNTGNPSRLFNNRAMERQTCDQSHRGANTGQRCPKGGQT